MFIVNLIASKFGFLLFTLRKYIFLLGVTAAFSNVPTEKRNAYI